MSTDFDPARLRGFLDAEFGAQAEVFRR